MKDYGDVLIPAHDGSQYLHAVHHGHYDIEDDQAGFEVLEDKDRLDPVRGMLRNVTFVSEFLRKELDEILVVVDDQDRLSIVQDRTPPPMDALASAVLKEARFVPVVTAHVT